MSEHKQVCVKVNAYVDETIAPVIEAMNKIPNLTTEYSCEDVSSAIRKESELPRTYVIFHFRNESDNWKDLSDLCNTLAQAVKEYRSVEVNLIWREGLPIGSFEFFTKDAYWIEKAIDRVY